jgi:hypothetical protein
VTEAPVSLGFFDREQQLHGEVRGALTLLFEGKSASAVPSTPELAREGEGWRARLPDRFELAFEPVADPIELAGHSTRLCRVTGTVDGKRIDCLGTATETLSVPSWSELDAVRSISALFDEETALLAVTRRPRGSLGHGDERVEAGLLAAGELLAVENARVSTVYDGDGRQRSAGIELWLPGEDFPRRAFGVVAAGTSLDLEGLRVNAAVFEWRMDGREGAGAYDLMVRSEPPEAA